MISHFQRGYRVVLVADSWCLTPSVCFSPLVIDSGCSEFQRVVVWHQTTINCFNKSCKFYGLTTQHHWVRWENATTMITLICNAWGKTGSALLAKSSCVWSIFYGKWGSCHLRPVACTRHWSYGKRRFSVLIQCFKCLRSAGMRPGANYGPNYIVKIC
jgi:hypothetical protein